MKKNSFKKVAIVGFIILLSIIGGYGNSFSQQGEVVEKSTENPVGVNQHYEMNLDEQGRAVHGYDTVAFHRQNQSVPGNDQFKLLWRNAIWRFTSAEHLALFEKNPEKYAPANGGYCTFGVALGKKFDGDPKVWVVKNERLHVFLNDDIKMKFMLDEEGNIRKADQYWPKIKNKSADEL